MNTALASQPVAATKAPGSVSHTEFSSNLDFLRSVAVLLVVLNHLGPAIGITGVAALGHLGVLLFFVHTSLVLMMSMDRLRLQGAALYWSFLMRRIFRIYPLSIFSVLSVIAIGFAPGPWNWRIVCNNLLLVQNLTGDVSINPVLWSLPFELQMYLVLPLLFLFLPRLGTRAAIWLWGAGLALATLEALARPTAVDASGLLLRYVPCFLGGVAAWLILIMNPAPRLAAWVWPLWVTALVLLYRIIWLFRGFGLNFNQSYRPHWPLWMDVIIEAAICLLLGLSIPWFRQITNPYLTAVSKQIARFSYGIYLTHSAMIWLCYSKWSTGWKFLNALDSLAWTAVASVLLYYFIEKPFITVGKRFAIAGEPGKP